jgi:hypothetical protein
MARQPPRPRRQLAVGEALASTPDRHGPRGPLRLGRDELVEGRGGRRRRPAGTAPGPQLHLLGGGEHRQRACLPEGIGHRRRQQRAEALQEAPRRHAVEQVGGVLERGGDPLVDLGQPQGQIELGRPLLQRHRLQREPAQFQPASGFAQGEGGEGGRRARRGALEHEHGLEHRRAGGVPLRLDGLGEQGERVAGAGQRGPDLPARPAEQLREGRPVREIGPQRHGIDEVAHHGSQRGPAAAGGGRADHQIVLARVPVEQGLERRRQDLERGGAVGPGEGAHGRPGNLETD